MSQETSTVTLRALSGAPLAERRVRDMVVAAANALGERHGVEVLRVDAAPDRITCVIGGDRLVALGFAAELRRTTSAWYEHTHGLGDMWGEPTAVPGWQGPGGGGEPPGGGDSGDSPDGGPRDGRTDGG